MTTSLLHTKEKISVCIGEADQPVGTLIYTKQGARENTSFAYSAKACTHLLHPKPRATPWPSKQS